MKFMKKLLLISTLLSIFTMACNIGLGEAVDLMPPELTITNPEIAASVNEIIELSGTAKDNEGVRLIKVTIDEIGLQYEWRRSDSKWYKKSGESWNELKDSKGTVEDKTVHFKLFIEVEDGVNSGDDITISTQAFDDLGNEGKTSKDDRVVTMDIKAPTVSVVEPVLVKNYEKALVSHNEYELQNSSVLSKLYNQNIVFSGFQKEDTKLERLLVCVDSSDSTELPENENELNKSSLLYSKEFTGTGIRNWNFEIKANEIPTQYRTNKHLFRVFTYSYDTAGNCESKLQGWFTYWNEADKPWLSATFGKDNFSDLNNNEQVYPNCTLLGQSYDDDGIAEVIFKTVKVAEDGNEISEVPELTKTINLASENYPKYYAWSTNAIKDLGYFYVEVKCKDKNGIYSDTIKKYLQVADITKPTIEVTSDLQLPLEGKEFTISGYVFDDGGAQKLMMVHLPENINEQQSLEYINGYKKDIDELVWNKGKDNEGKDKFGNIFWEIPLGSPEINNGIKNNFSQTVNWETDLGINSTNFTDGAKLTSQTFILCAYDGQGLSETKMITLSGDTSGPSLTIDEVIVISGSEQKSTSFIGENGKLITPELNPYKRNTKKEITDKVQLKGTWKDDSIFTSSITLNWQDGPAIEITKNSNGTWESNLITPPDLTTAVLEAQIKDLGGNTTIVNQNFIVNGAIAQFSRISSDMATGSYNSGNIEIFIQFTKPVTFKEGSSNPYLELNNGGKATLVPETNGSDTHKFIYSIPTRATKEEKGEIPINVTKIITNGNKWYDGDIVIWNEEGASEISMVGSTFNLQNNKKIIVDNVPPRLTEIKATSSGGYYKAGSTLYFAGTFSEPVKNTMGSNGLKLTFNNGKTVEVSAQPSQTAVQFIYTVAPNDDIANLAVQNITWGTNLTDIAGNKILTNTPSYSGISSIHIDTKAPTGLGITLSKNPTGEGTRKVIYDEQTITATLQFDKNETTGKRQYTTAYISEEGASNTWQTISVNNEGKATRELRNGEYIINIRQEDSAGNVTVYNNPIAFNVDFGHILKSVRLDKPSGDYKVGDTLKYTLTFRNPVTANNSKLVIGNTSNTTWKQINLKSGCSGTKEFVYEYSIQSGDDITNLEVQNLTGTYYDTYGNNIDSFVTLDNSSVVKEDKVINIDTSTPSVENVEFKVDGNGDQILTILFTQKINSRTTDNTKKVTLTIQNANSNYKIPAVISKEDWKNKYSSNSTIAEAYESNTIGCSSSYVPDLTEKYVLKFDKNTNDATLRNTFISLKAHETSLSVNSTDVTIDNNKLILNFRNSIPVKGTTYTVDIPEGIILNKMEKGNTGNTSITIDLKGVEPVYIRVQKKNEWVEGGNIKQPINAEAKLDCQTPGVTLSYTMKTYAGYDITMVANGSDNVRLQRGGNNVTSAPSHNGQTPTTTTVSYTENDTISLTAGNDNDQNGCQIEIEATAAKNGESNKAYEKAVKTVIKFTERSTANGYNYRAIRGGDKIYGAVNTPNFPFSWNTNELDKIRVMTNSSGNNYYLVSWKITKTAYINFLAVDGTATSKTDSVTHEPRPTNWWWASCGWVPNVEQYPIYPGETTTLDANVLGGKNGGFQYMNKHKQSATPPNE